MFRADRENVKQRHLQTRKPHASRWNAAKNGNAITSIANCKVGLPDFNRPIVVFTSGRWEEYQRPPLEEYAGTR